MQQQSHAAASDAEWHTQGIRQVASTQAVPAAASSPTAGSLKQPASGQQASIAGLNQLSWLQHSLYSRSGTELGGAAGTQLELPPAHGHETAMYAPDKASSHTTPGLPSVNATYLRPAGHLLQSDYEHGWKVDAEHHNVGTITPQQNSRCSSPWWPNQALDIDPCQSTTVEAPAHPAYDPSDVKLADLSLETDQLELSPHNGRDSLEMFRDPGHQAMWRHTTAPQPEENPWAAVTAQARYCICSVTSVQSCICYPCTSAHANSNICCFRMRTCRCA